MTAIFGQCGRLDSGAGSRLWHPLKGNYSSWLGKSSGGWRKRKERGRPSKALQRELEWLHMAPKARQAKSKARITRYNDLVAQRRARQREREITSHPARAWATWLCA